jgi:hypothetical protein
MVWSHFISDGGWGMFPTMIFAALLMLAAAIYAFRPERRFVPLIFSLGIITLASGLLGFCVGVITTFQYAARNAPPAEIHSLTLVGVAESTNNIVLALIGIVLAGIVASVGAIRIARTAP